MVSLGEQGNGSTGWLLGPPCSLDGATPERRKTKHVYLRLDLLQRDVESWFGTVTNNRSQNCKSITQKWLDEGLESGRITRDIKWSVRIPSGLDSLPDKDYAKKVFYIWFDACSMFPEASPAIECPC